MHIRLIETIHEGERDFLRGRALGVSGVRFSPDGALLAYGVRGVSDAPTGHTHESGMQQRHYTVKLRDMADLLPRTVPAPDAPGRGGEIVFSPDGGRMASISGRLVDLWRVEDGRLIATRGFPFAVLTILLEGAPGQNEPPNERLYAAQKAPLPFRFAGGGVRAWDIAGPDRRRVVPVGRGGSITALASDRRIGAIYAGGRDGNLRRLDSPEMLPPLNGAPITGLALYDSWLLFGRADGALGRLERQRGEVSVTLSTVPSRVCALDIAADGRTAAFAFSDGRAALWSVEAWEPLQVWQAHDGAADALSFSPDGTLLATSGADFRVKLWRVE